MIIEIILGILLLTSISANIIQLKRQETLETWFEDMSSDLDKVQKEFLIIDEKKMFESDDEVGDTFERLKLSLNKIQKYTGVEEDGNTSK
jgi:hypothetical protein|tara:strand:+ start:1240 stop:1509 length:270 start_codon:yes stop_codon:yes gene_type:complete